MDRPNECDVNAFVIDEIINQGRGNDGVVVAIGTFARSNAKALVKVARARPPTERETLQRALETSTLRARAPYSGAEYVYLCGSFGEDCDRASVNVDVVCPSLCATTEDAREKAFEKHVTRARAQKMVAFRETKEMYDDAHEEVIKGISPDATAWVRKILSLESERERLLHADGEFLLNTDPKWHTHPSCDGSDRQSWFKHASVVDLYCLGICQRRDVRSMRDLRAEHLPLLRAMLNVGRDVIERVYGVTGEEMRVFVHYPPQFYHFHVHYQALSAQEVGCQTERAHLLEDIIDNIERDGDFYAKANITVKVGESEDLVKLYRACMNAPRAE